MTWWRDGVLYQIYPRSYADANGDGIGDLRGITEHLDHLQWLGIVGIWLNPTMPSPNDDWGYDVSDYLGVHPDLGTPEDLEHLIAEAGERDIRVLLDLVPNHTSDRHPWFREHPDYYVWAPGRDGGPPNNWRSAFGGSAWTKSGDAYYLHNFLPTQPDLDWWNEAVREEFDAILRHWFARGVAGFRIDVCHAIIKDRELRDDPPATEDDHPQVRAYGLRREYSMNRPEVHDVLRRWHEVAHEFDPPRVLVGETYVLELDRLATFYGAGDDELDLAFNFLFVHADFEADALREIVEGVEARLPELAWPVYTGSNHDAGRLMTRWCGDDPIKARAALMMLLTLRGTPFLYYGDEIAMPDVDLDAETALDPVARRTGDPSHNRDRCRTPMQWRNVEGGGFSAAEPWLPLGDYAARNVEDQKHDPGSVLTMVRDLIDLRAQISGAYTTLDAPPGAWVYRRGERHAVALNLSDSSVEVQGLAGVVALGTDRARDGEHAAGRLHVGPWEGLVVELADAPLGA